MNKNFQYSFPYLERRSIICVCISTKEERDVEKKSVALILLKLYKKWNGKYEKLIQFNASHVPKWSKQYFFLSFWYPESITPSENCWMAERQHNYGFFRFAFFKWT